MTEQQLIYKLNELKKIKPNAEWVSLSKTAMFNVKKEVSNPVSKVSFSNIVELFAQKRLAFAFATLLFVFIGTAGLLNYQINDVVQVASLNYNTDIIAVNTLKDSIKEFQLKSQILSDAVKNKSQNLNVAIEQVKVASKILTNSIQKNPKLAKKVALEVNNSKTIFNIPGGGEDLKEALGAPVDALVKQIFKDGKDVTYTEDGQNEFNRIEKAYNEDMDSGKALRDLIILSASSAGVAN